MNKPDTVIFKFDSQVSMEQVAQTLQLALVAVQSMYGTERVRLEASSQIVAEEHLLSIDRSTSVGRSFAAIFFGYVRREFGNEAVEIVRGDGPAEGA